MPDHPPCRLTTHPLPEHTHVPGGPWPRPAPLPQEPDEALRLGPTSWREQTHYLLGLDLFNAGFFFEAHEHWEVLWHAAGRKGPTADFLKGLIKLAAAGVKHLEGRPKGVKAHAARAAELWRGVAGDPVGEGGEFLGFRLGALIAVAEGVAREGWPQEQPVILLASPEGAKL